MFALNANCLSEWNINCFVVLLYLGNYRAVSQSSVLSPGQYILSLSATENAKRTRRESLRYVSYWMDAVNYLLLLFGRLLLTVMRYHFLISSENVLALLHAVYLMHVIAIVNQSVISLCCA